MVLIRDLHRSWLDMHLYCKRPFYKSISCRFPVAACWRTFLYSWQHHLCFETTFVRFPTYEFRNTWDIPFVRNGRQPVPFHIYVQVYCLTANKKLSRIGTLKRAAVQLSFLIFIYMYRYPFRNILIKPFCITHTHTDTSMRTWRPQKRRFFRYDISVSVCSYTVK